MGHVYELLVLTALASSESSNEHAHRRAAKDHTGMRILARALVTSIHSIWM